MNKQMIPVQREKNKINILFSITDKTSLQLTDLPIDQFANSIR
jgi:hypothetical protein